MDIDKYYITYTTITNSTPVSVTVAKTKSGSNYDANGTNLKNWMSGKDIKTIKVESVATLKSARDLFDDKVSITEIDLSNFDTSLVTNMEGMFYGCDNLVTLNISTLNTSKVTNMSWMFHGCSALTRIDVSSFDTSKVTDMLAMFGYCEALTTLNISNFNLNEVRDMDGMFDPCDSLNSLYLGSFNVSNSLAYYEDLFSSTNNYHIYFEESQSVISTRKGYPWDVHTSRFIFDYIPTYPVKIWNGSAWVAKNYKIWDGTQWNESIPLKLRHNNKWINIT